MQKGIVKLIDGYEEFYGRPITVVSFISELKCYRCQFSDGSEMFLNEGEFEVVHD